MLQQLPSEIDLTLSKHLDYFSIIMLCMTAKRYQRIYNNNYFWNSKIAAEYNLVLDLAICDNFRELYIDFIGDPTKLDLNNIISLKKIIRYGNLYLTRYVLQRVKTNNKLVAEILYDIVRLGNVDEIYQLEPYIDKQSQNIYYEMVIVNAVKNNNMNSINKVKNKVKNYWFHVARGAIINSNLKLLERCLRKLKITRGKTFYNFSKKIQNIVNLIADAAANDSIDLVKMLTEKYYIPNMKIMSSHLDTLMWITAIENRSLQSLRYIKYYYNDINNESNKIIIDAAIEADDIMILNEIIEWDKGQIIDLDQLLLTAGRKCRVNTIITLLNMGVDKNNLAAVNEPITDRISLLMLTV